MENAKKGSRMNVCAVVFDLDGTLLDTLGDLAAAVNYAMRTHGYEERSIEEVRRFVGNGIGKLIRRSLPEDVSDSVASQVLDTFRAYYLAHCVEQTAPYAGVEAMLAALRERGIGMAIVSNKLQPAVTALAERFFSTHIGVAIGESDTVRRKPAPDSVWLALERLGVKPDEAIYVGDSEVDIQTAAAAGVRVVSVTWGFRDRSDLEALGPDALIDTPEALLGVL